MPILYHFKVTARSNHFKVTARSNQSQYRSSHVSDVFGPLAKVKHSFNEKYRLQMQAKVSLDVYFDQNQSFQGHVKVIQGHTIRARSSNILLILHIGLSFLCAKNHGSILKNNYTGSINVRAYMETAISPSYHQYNYYGFLCNIRCWCVGSPTQTDLNK